MEFMYIANLSKNEYIRPETGQYRPPTIMKNEKTAKLILFLIEDRWKGDQQIMFIGDEYTNSEYYDRIEDMRDITKATVRAYNKELEAMAYDAAGQQ